MGLFATLAGKVDEFLANRKNVNNVVDIWSLMKEDPKNQVPCILALERLFTEVLKRQDFTVNPDLRLINAKAWESESQYSTWLQDAYEKTLAELYLLMKGGETLVAAEALGTAMKLLTVEGCYPVNQTHSIANTFPFARFKEVLKVLLEVESNTKLAVRFEEFSKLKDVLFYSWKILKSLVPSHKVQTVERESFLLNVLELLDKLALPKTLKNEKVEVPDDELLCPQKERTEKEAFQLDIPQITRWMSRVWQSLISLPSSPSTHRRTLLLLLETYLHRLHRPVFLTDYLMASMNLGGANSLLALQGISVLIQKHNIEYPNIYGKLYTMFEPEIYHSKYKSRLFYLADLFLSSTHLSEQLVAAFAKRVSRLCLSAQIPDILISVQFVGNLLLRHPGLQRMIHHPVGGEVAEDPFLPEESDPLKSCAVQSSLWELGLLQRHVQPRVSTALSFLDLALPSVEWDLATTLETTTDKILEGELKKKKKRKNSKEGQKQENETVSVTFIRPQCIAQLKDDRSYKLWSLS